MKPLMSISDRSDRMVSSFEYLAGEYALNGDALSTKAEVKGAEVKRAFSGSESRRELGL